MANTVRAIPEGYHSITPSLTCREAAKAIDFYKKAFGAKENHRMQGPDGKIGHAELQIGDSRLMLNDEFPSMASGPDPNSKSAPSSYLLIYTSDVDTAFNKAVSAGCKVTMPLQNQFWGDRYGRLADPFGHHWGLAQHVEDVAPAEMERRAKEWQEKMAKSAGAHN
jgi:PhnB protein